MVGAGGSDKAPASSNLSLKGENERFANALQGHKRAIAQS
jgi:hypothetical protein